ncbi:signal peptidase I [Mycena olivaceomarginata]|nr:signal peptidase I [Mycena olivaceomarginata]
MRGARVRRVLLQAQAIALSLASTFMIYTALGLLTNCKSPIVVVLSGSMEPGIYRGDLLFLSNNMPQNYVTGDITVYQVTGEAITIVHRVVETHNGPGASSHLFLTKGDNNDIGDVSLYQGLERLERKHVIGRVRGIIPLVGYVSIFFNELPRLRNHIFEALRPRNIFHI